MRLNLITAGGHDGAGTKVIIPDAHNLSGMKSMKNLKSFLTSIAFSLAGIAVHTNAATENHRNTSGVCFQLTPLSSKRTLPQSVQEGSSS